MTDDSAGKSPAVAEPPATQTGRIGRVVGWCLLGALAGSVLVALFFAYGQPALLLEQLNLRYCG